VAIVKTISKYQFIDMWPESRKDNFSYEGLCALYDYLYDLSDDLGETIEYDPVAICSEYTEYEDLAELQGNYTDIESWDDLQAHTTVIPVDDIDMDDPDSDGRFIIVDY
jgi:hypothetical protein